jgi:hypothetical protein
VGTTTTRLPVSGIQSVVTTARQVTLASVLDPLSVVSTLETVTRR